MQPPQPSPHPAPAKRARDIRLDFFRGVCLFIIFIAHIFDNPWALFIPARFGLSDAADIFVFLSGMASAVAFATVFVRRGLMMGTARIAHRMWQVYWAHIAIFLFCAAIMVLFDRHLRIGEGYVNNLMMENLFNQNAASALVGLLTLTYVPPFFDILPMYLVILGMVPLVMALADFNKWYAVAAVVLTWFVASFGVFDMPRAPWNNETWFFNPFSWQLIFFTGFALMRGWLPAPKSDSRLIAAAIIYLVICVPFSWNTLMDLFPVLRDVRDSAFVFLEKTHMGILRYLHFMAIAYLAYIAVGDGGRRLTGPFVAVIAKVGQQSLGIFLATLALSFSASALLDVIGRGFLASAAVNLGGMSLMVALAYMLAWFKSTPWKAEPRPPARPAPAAIPRSSPVKAGAEAPRRLGEAL